MERECKKHGLTSHAERKENGEHRGWRCRKCTVDAVSEWRRRLKKKAVEHMGGQCVKCGYDKFQGALIFHHRENNKSFGVSGHGNTRAWDRVVEELKKCDMLCLNCHAEEHHGE
jgi:hypothetical protein